MSAQETAEAPNVTVLETLELPKVETPQAEAPAAPEAPEPPAEEGQERDEAGKFQKNGTQARIDELTRQRHEAAREAAYWKGQAEATKARPEQEAPQGEPTPDQFQDYAQYVKAQAKWEVRQESQQERQRQREHAQASAWADRVAAAKVQHPDFDSVMNGSTAPMSAAMAEAIKDSDIGPTVARHLALNPSEAARIAQLSPTGAAREIGKLEASLSAPKTAPVQRTTQAPQPAQTIGAGRSLTGDPGKMNQADYLQWRASQLKESR